MDLPGKDKLDGKVDLCIRPSGEEEVVLVGRFLPSELRILASVCGWDSRDVSWTFDPERRQLWVEVKVHDHQKRG